MLTSQRRKVRQISACSGHEGETSIEPASLYALTENGEIWELTYGSRPATWSRVPLFPGQEIDNPSEE